MSDIWSPPPPDPLARTKPPQCGARKGTLRCTLYVNHVARQHRDQHKNESWDSEGSS